MTSGCAQEGAPASRFLLYYTGKGPQPLADVADIEGIPGVTVVAQPPARTVVLDIAHDAAVQRVRQLPQWVLQQSQPVTLESTPCPGLPLAG